MRRTLNLLILLFTAVTVSAQSTFTSSLKAKPKKGATIYGVVECNGAPVEGVVVSDGYSVVKTDKHGVYNIASQKQNGNVFISIPRGYEALTAGDDVVPQFWAELSVEPQTAERHDFALKAVNNDNHIIVAVADIHLANRLNDVQTFRDSFVANLTAEIEQYRSKGIPVYTLSMGDNSFDIYWYDYLYDIGDFRRTLAEVKYPTPFFNTMGNHDNDGATPYDENTDFNAAAKYRKAFGPTYYSFNLGKVHYIMLDDMVYLNEPLATAKRGKGIVGARNHTTALTREQIDWLAKDLAIVTDKTTPIVIGVHSPIFRYVDQMDGTVECRLPAEQKAELTALLKDFSTVHILSGHTHRNRCCYGYRDSAQPDIANITEHTIAAVSGTRWHTSAFGGPQIAVTGEPAGCKIFKIDNTDIEWYFKATEFDAATQFRCFDMNTVRDYFKSSGELKVFFDHFPKRTNYANFKKDNAIMINVWDWAPDWKIKVTENGKELEVVRKRAENPQYMLSYEVPKSLWMLDLGSESRKKKVRHPHMFHAVASSPTSTVEVTVTDSFGNIYHQTMERPKPFSVNIE